MPPLSALLIVSALLRGVAALTPRQRFGASRRGQRMYVSGEASATIVTSEYEYDGWRCSYRHRPAGPKGGSRPPLLLVHPIGIGMSGWFWERLMSAYEGDDAAPAIYAPDLIGCGASTPWEPQERGLFLPLDYSRQCEQLWRVAIGEPCVVVTQGGLAPVGVLLASRMSDTWNGELGVERLILASPPTWEEISTDSDRAAAARAFSAFASPLGAASYKLLQLRAFVRFFSNLFLFDAVADEEWVEQCCTEAAQPSAQWPVFAFNAGIVGARGYFDELVGAEQPVLLLEGASDRRQRDGYAENMRRCQRATINEACNVLPYEQADATREAIDRFCNTPLARLPRSGEGGPLDGLALKHLSAHHLPS